MAWYYWVPFFIGWNLTIWAAWHKRLRDDVETAWTVGWKIGRASALIGTDVVDRWLTEAGIDPSMLPPVD